MTKPAATLYRAIEHYLAGCQNESALEDWRLAVGESLQRGEAFDAFLGRAARASRTRRGATPSGRSSPNGTSGAQATPVSQRGGRP